MRTAAVLIGLVVASGDAGAAVSPAITTVYDATDPRGVMVTTGGWPYCQQLRRLARRTHYTLLCSRFRLDGYVGRGLRGRRHLDWGNPQYLVNLARRVRSTHARVGGKLLFLGVSYSGFGVATLAAHHPELRPDRVIVIDSYFDLVARRRRLPPRHETAREIDRETGGSVASLRARSANVRALAKLVRAGTGLTVIWTVSPHEKRLFAGATCNREASAGTLAALARALRRPVTGWVTRERHGYNLWNHGPDIVRGRNPGRRISFRPGAPIPPLAIC